MTVVGKVRHRPRIGNLLIGESSVTEGGNTEEVESDYPSGETLDLWVKSEQLQMGIDGYPK